MGLIFSRFRRKKTSDEILEEIHSDIQSLESDRNVVLQRQNYIVGRLIIYSIILYVITAALFYFCFFPASLTDRMFYMIPLLAFPLLVFLLKKFIVWYYRREITHNRDKLSELKAKKKKILEDVMNKETYKVAKEILEKYAPEQLKKPGLEPTLKPLPVTSSLQLPASKDTKSAAPSPPPHQLQVAMVGAPQQPLVGFSPVHKKPAAPMVLQRRQGSPQNMHPSEGGGRVSPQRRLVRPIIPRERNLIDRLIESIVGDGPSNRYALICKNCSSHNGMALKEEFEYLAFRCAYCGFPNPSHKVRPVISQPHSRSSSEERRSIEVPEKIGESNESLKTSKETEVTKICSEDHSDGGPLEVPESPAESADVDASRSEADSDESSSTPSGGVRPRKPLHLTD